MAPDPISNLRNPPPPTRPPNAFRGAGTATQGATGIVQAMDGMITSLTAAHAETERSAKEILACSERTATLMGSILDRATTLMAIKGGFGSYAAPSVMSESSRVPGSPIDASVPTPTPVAPKGGIQTASSDPSRPDSPTVADEDRHRPVKHQAPNPMPRSFKAGQEFAGGQSGHFDIGKIRQNMGSKVNQRVSEWATKGEQTMVDRATGEPIVLDGVKQVRRVPIGSPKTALADKVTERGADGVLKTVMKNEGGAGLRAEGAGVLKNVAGGLAQGEGMGAAIGGALPTVGAVAGGAGLAYMAVKTGIKFAQDQRAKNAEFQEMTGGTNASGFGERMNQNVFRMKNMFSMGSGDAEAIYKGAAQNYSTDKKARGAYQDAAVGLYSRAGLGGQESTRLLNTAAEEGNTNLKQFADSIVAVGRAAAESGGNVKQARADFEQAFKQASTFTSGATASRSAQAVADVKTNLGPQFHNTDFSGMDSEINHRRMAGMTTDPKTGKPYTYAAFSAEVNRDGPTSTLTLATGRQALLTQGVGAADPSGNLMRMADSKVKGLTGGKSGGELTDENVKSIAADLQTDSNFDPLVMQGIIKAQTGIDVPEAQAMEFWVRSNYKDVDFAKDEVKRLDELKNPVGKVGATGVVGGKKGPHFDITHGDFQTADKKGKFLQGKKHVGDRAAWDFAHDKLGIGNSEEDKQHFKEGNFDTDTSKTPFKRRGEEARASAALANQVSNTGKVSGSGYAIYKDFDNYKGSRYEVKTKGGKTRSVDIQELITDYSDQLDHDPDSIKISGGKYSGQTVGKALGKHGVDESVKVTSDKDGKGSKGKSTAEADKAAKKGGGNVTLSPTPLLAKYLQMVPDAGSNVTVATDYASNGQPPPASPDLNPDTRNG